MKKLTLIAILILFPSVSFSATIAPSPKFRAMDLNGDPCVGCKLYTYQTGTTTPKVTYTNSGALTPNSNPIILNSYGECDLWLDNTAGGTTNYRLRLDTASDVTLWTVDDISDTNFVNLTTFLVEHNADGTQKRNWFLLSSYDTLEDALAAINSFVGATGEAELWLDKSVTLQGNVTVPEYIHLRGMNVNCGDPCSAVPIITAGNNLTINGPFYAEPFRVFNTDGGGEIKFGRTPPVVYAEWWGILGASDEVGINKALDSFNTGSKGTVQLLGKQYFIDGTIFMQPRVKFKGTGSPFQFDNDGGSIITWNGNAAVGSVMIAGDAVNKANKSTIEDITFNAYTSATQYAESILVITDFPSVKIYRCNFIGHNESDDYLDWDIVTNGITGDAEFDSIVRDCNFWAMKYGMNIENADEIIVSRNTFGRIHTTGFYAESGGGTAIGVRLLFNNFSKALGANGIHIHIKNVSDATIMGNRAEATPQGQKATYNITNLNQIVCKIEDTVVPPAMFVNVAYNEFFSNGPALTTSDGRTSYSTGGDTVTVHDFTSGDGTFLNNARFPVITPAPTHWYFDDIQASQVQTPMFFDGVSAASATVTDWIMPKAGYVSAISIQSDKTVTAGSATATACVDAVCGNNFARVSAAGGAPTENVYNLLPGDLPFTKGQKLTLQVNASATLTPTGVGLGPNLIGMMYVTFTGELPLTPLISP